MVVEDCMAQIEKPFRGETPSRVGWPLRWTSFRGERATGIADGQLPPTTWNAIRRINVRWKTPIPGLGHSSPIVWDDRVFVTTAISGDPDTPFRPGLNDSVESVNDTTLHTWRVYCVDYRTGKILWDRLACQGVPKTRRHTKGSQANCTPAADGTHLVVCFGSEGLYCYDFDGKLLWKRDLAAHNWPLDAGHQWGFGSSPTIYGNLANLVIVQCDVGKNSFIAAYNVSDGKLVWLTPREEAPCWATPTIFCGGLAPIQVVTNASKYIRGYDPLTGKELWRLALNCEIAVPTPIADDELIFVTSGYLAVQRLYAIQPNATGDISLKKAEESNQFIAWSKKRGGPYVATPIVYEKYLYTCSNNGTVTCYEARTGKQIYCQPLRGSGVYTASPIAADGKLYFTSEENGIHVIKAGPKFEVLSVNAMGDVCMATPAISDGMIFVRTQHFLYGIGTPGMLIPPH
jgi:outer membrane protein assembly factor BamB